MAKDKRLFYVLVEKLISGRRYIRFTRAAGFRRPSADVAELVKEARSFADQPGNLAAAEFIYSLADALEGR